MNEFIEIIKSIGFPIFVAVFLLWQMKDLKGVIKDNTKVLSAFCEREDIKNNIRKGGS